MKKLEFSGKTLDDALEKAAEVFQTNKALIQYDVTISEKPGFFAKLFSRGVTIKAWMDDSSFDLAALTRQTVENSLRPSKKENRTADRKKTPLQKPAKKELQPRKTRDDHNTQESTFMKVLSLFLKIPQRILQNHFQFLLNMFLLREQQKMLSL